MPGEDHRNAEGVAGGDDLLLADRAAGLDHGGDAALDAELGPMGEGEVGIGGEGGGGQQVGGTVAAGLAALLDREADRVEGLDAATRPAVGRPGLPGWWLRLTSCRP